MPVIAPVATSAMTINTAPWPQALLVFRTLVGFGIAGAHVAYTLFMEYLPPAHRGVWLTAIELFWTLGSLALAGLAWAVLPSSLGWRGLVVLAALPLALLMALWPCLKESPHWLLASGHDARAQVRRQPPLLALCCALCLPLVYRAALWNSGAWCC